jgi:hypothetical protein
MGIKRTNQSEEHKQLASYRTKFLEVVLCEGIQSNLNTIHHHLTPILDCHAKLMRQQMKKECISELNT